MARQLFEEPRTATPLLEAARETYRRCATYRAQGAVRVVRYEETARGGGFLFQSDRGPARTKTTKLFTTAFRRDPLALRQEIISLGLGRSFTSVEYWGPQRHAIDHYSSVSLPMAPAALAAAIEDNQRVVVDFDPAPDWLLASCEPLAAFEPTPPAWPAESWWIGEEDLAGVPTDLIVGRTNDGARVALWLTRNPVAVVKVMAEQEDAPGFASVTALIQPEFGVTVGQDDLALNRPRPPFFDVDPSTIAFGALELPAIPDGSPARQSAAGITDVAGRSSDTPEPAVEPAPAPKSRVLAGPDEMDGPTLPGSDLREAGEPDTTNALLSPEQMEAIVVIEGDQGVGTGFFCNIRGRDFIVTNQHVLAGNRRVRLRTTDGDPIEAGDIYGAVGHDIALIAVGQPKGTLAAAASVAADTEIGDRVVVPGNKLGGGVVTQVAGRVLGIGPDRVEIDAKFVPGNSGSPIINLDTGEVIGVATYVRKDMPENFAEESAVDEDSDEGAIVRWFGYRIDSVEQWERIDWNRWQRQYQQVTDFNDISMAIYEYLADKPAFYDNRDMRALFDDYLEAMSERSQVNEHYERATKLYIQRIINLARRDLPAMEQTQFYDYFQSTAGPEHNVTENVRYRELLIEHLEGLGLRWRILANRLKN